MKLFCQILHKIVQSNSSQLTGICYDSATLNARLRPKDSLPPAPSAFSPEKKLEFYSQQHQQERLSHELATHGAEDSEGAAVYIIVVLCFYSLSILFMVVFNIKFKIVLKQGSSYLCCVNSDDHLYESQKDETKNTIHMIFNDSGKMLSSVVLPKSDEQKARKTLVKAAAVVEDDDDGGGDHDPSLDAEYDEENDTSDSSEQAARLVLASQNMRSLSKATYEPPSSDDEHMNHHSNVFIV